MSRSAQNLLDRWTDLVIGHPKVVIVLCAAACLALAFVASRTPADLSFTGMTDPDDPDIIGYQEVIRTFGANMTLLMMLEGEPEAVDGGLSQRAYLNSFSATIGGGTSQIQANIVAEHVLGLPKH